MTEIAPYVHIYFLFNVYYKYHAIMFFFILIYLRMFDLEKLAPECDPSSEWFTGEVGQ